MNKREWLVRFLAGIGGFLFGVGVGFGIFVLLVGLS